MNQPALLLAAWLTLAGLAVGCDDGSTAEPPPPDAQGHADLGPDADAPDAALDAAAPNDAAVDQFVRPTGIPETVRVVVTLDDAPAANVRVTQGGTQRWRFTDADGVIEAFPLDATVVGDVTLVGSHPEARQRSAWIYDGFRGEATIGLTRYGPDDPTYQFADPGEPGRRATTTQCGHCHLRINDAWSASVHRDSAKNPVVHDLYAGTASGRTSPAACEAAGGRWAEGRLPGGGTGPRCELGVSAQGLDAPGCADCHAPAMNGALGGRDLLDAEGIAYEYGVSCDVCHRVDRVEPTGAPGVAGRLVLTRPSDPGPITLGAGGRIPLTFGPSHDSPNPRMGNVQRDHYRDGSICSGCHEYRHAPLAGGALDATRWPAGTLPIQSTYSEWRAGPYAEAVMCNGCHMPPDPISANGADLQAFPDAEVGTQGGWFRPAGSVRRHSWTGPRDPDGRLLQLAASLRVAKTVTDDGVTAEITVRNVGAGHALPTGEPMRQMVLLVEATCEGAPLAATGGDVVPDYGGGEMRAGGDWSVWPGAAVGDRLRVVAHGEGWHDYPATGRFAEFDAEAKGLPVTRFVGEVVITAVDPAGRLTTEPALPAGDVAYRLPAEAPAPGWAGHPGFAWARVPVSADGRRMVHHLEAVDLASDNRLPPLASWTSRHTFAACAAPTIRARLYHRAHPWAMTLARGWAPRDTLMAEAQR